MNNPNVIELDSTEHSHWKYSILNGREVEIPKAWSRKGTTDYLSWLKQTDEPQNKRHVMLKDSLIQALEFRLSNPNSVWGTHDGHPSYLRPLEE